MYGDFLSLTLNQTNVQKISTQEYKKGTAYLENCKDKNNRVLFFEETVVVVSEDGAHVYIHSDKKFYKDTATQIAEIYHSLRNLYLREIAMYRNAYGESGSHAVDELMFLYGPLDFSFKGIRELAYATERAKYVYRKK